jgi:uncharacterized membrane protein
MNFIFSFIISFLIFMVLDGSWIIFNNDYYMKLNKKIQKEPFVFKLPAILIAYIILGLALYLYLSFIINEKFKKNKYLLTFIYGCLYGLAIYGTYSFTSCAYYKNYTYYDAFIDTIWGMILFGLSGLIFISIYK